MIRVDPSSPEISTEELRDILTNGGRVIVLDVRTAADRAEWSIPGSQHIDAYDALQAGDPRALAGVELAHGVPVVTVCNAGATSQIAMRQLREQGYQAVSLKGGMNAWSLAWNTAELAFPMNTTTVVQVRRTGKGCLSYIIGNGGEAVVIDAALEPAVYVEVASERGWRITHVVDTHIHADHFSSSRSLAELTTATLHLPRQQRASFPFEPLDEGDTIAIGNSAIRALGTPGHTMESMTYVLDEEALLTGDTLFLSGVGRPDLEASTDEARARAGLLFESLQRLGEFPPAMLVLPGHTDRPVPFDGEPVAMPLGQVIAGVEAMRLTENEFAERILARIPPAPPNHSTIVAFNEAGEMPISDRIDLEAGANRCAVS